MQWTRTREAWRLVRSGWMLIVAAFCYSNSFADSLKAIGISLILMIFGLLSLVILIPLDFFDCGFRHGGKKG